MGVTGRSLQELPSLVALVEEASNHLLEAWRHLTADDPNPCSFRIGPMPTHMLDTTDGYHQWQDKVLISLFF
jgi:hypothetical protein